MINAAQEIVFAARSRQHGREFRITERAADRHETADNPKQQQREAGPYVADLKSEAGEDTDADHIGDDNRRCRDP